MEQHTGAVNRDMGSSEQVEEWALDKNKWEGMIFVVIRDNGYLDKYCSKSVWNLSSICIYSQWIRFESLQNGQDGAGEWPRENCQIASKKLRKCITTSNHDDFKCSWKLYTYT